jgi:hypothetical protein
MSSSASASDPDPDPSSSSSFSSSSDPVPASATSLGPIRRSDEETREFISSSEILVIDRFGDSDTLIPLQAIHDEYRELISNITSYLLSFENKRVSDIFQGYFIQKQVQEDGTIEIQMVEISDTILDVLIIVRPRQEQPLEFAGADNSYTIQRRQIFTKDKKNQESASVIEFSNLHDSYKYIVWNICRLVIYHRNENGNYPIFGRSIDQQKIFHFNVLPYRSTATKVIDVITGTISFEIYICTKDQMESIMQRSDRQRVFFVPEEGSSPYLFINKDLGPTEEFRFYYDSDNDHTKVLSRLQTCQPAEEAGIIRTRLNRIYESISNTLHSLNMTFKAKGGIEDIEKLAYLLHPVLAISLHQMKTIPGLLSINSSIPSDLNPRRVEVKLYEVMVKNLETLKSNIERLIILVQQQKGKFGIINQIKDFLTLKDAPNTEDFPVCDFCHLCSVDGKPLLLCSLCKQAKYCSKECQKADWKKIHKTECIGNTTKKAGSRARSRSRRKPIKKSLRKSLRRKKSFLRKQTRRKKIKIYNIK